MFGSDNYVANKNNAPAAEAERWKISTREKGEVSILRSKEEAPVDPCWAVRPDGNSMTFVIN